jgi:hypothetical protein
MNYSTSKLYVTQTTMTGHGLNLAMQCDQCKVAMEWNGSSVYPDGSLMINCDIVRAWYTIGGKRHQYFKFTELMNCGQYNHDSYDKTVQLLQPIILEAEDKDYQENVDAVNGMKEDVILGCDCQHCRSQRAQGSAPYATSTFICHNQGSNYGKIIY